MTTAPLDGRQVPPLCDEVALRRPEPRCQVSVTSAAHGRCSCAAPRRRASRWAAGYLPACYTSAWQGSTAAAAAPLTGHILLRLWPRSHVDTRVTAGRWLSVRTRGQKKTWQRKAHIFFTLRCHSECVCVCVFGLVCFHARGP